MLRNKKLVVFKTTNTSNKWNKMEFAEKSRIPENEKIRKRGFSYEK